MRGYVWKDETGKLYLQRCPKCHKENYSLMVSTGQCAWCGYKAVESDVNEEDE